MKKFQVIEKVIDKTDPIVVKIAIVEDEDKKGANLFIKVIGKSHKLILLKQNGKVLEVGFDDLEQIRNKDDYVVYKYRLNLGGGHNEFECRVRNKAGFESVEAKVDLVSTLPIISATYYKHIQKPTTQSKLCQRRR